MDSTKTKVYVSNRAVLMPENGELIPYSRPVILDSFGVWYVEMPTKNFDYCDGPPSHWDDGPLEVKIIHPDYDTVHQTYSRVDLIKLRKQTFEKSGIRRIEGANGVWVLPEIRLSPRDSIP